MVKIDITYEGNLRSRARHGPSGTELVTDAPVDNQGKGESFSPTDLVATALGTCIVTIMGIVAERHGWDLVGTKVTVEKKMITEPVRKIGELEVVISIPADLDERARTTLEEAAHRCPVHKTLGDNVEMPVRFEWGTGASV